MSQQSQENLLLAIAAHLAQDCSRCGGSGQVADAFSARNVIVLTDCYKCRGLREAMKVPADMKPVEA